MRRNRERGLTLIEILLAMIIMMLGVVGILALFPTALGAARTSMEETNAAILAESIAHGLTNSIRFAEYDPTTKQWKVYFTHDLEGGTQTMRYDFLLPELADNTTGDDNKAWQRHPATSANSKGYNPPSPENHSQILPTEGVFRLGKDSWLAASHQEIKNVNENNDPYTQFAFRFDVRKVNRLKYMLNNPLFTIPGTTPPQQYTSEAELDPLVKLYEFRIHIYRVYSGLTSGGTTTTAGMEKLKWIATVTSSGSTR